MSIVNFCYAQAKIQVAVNTTAKEMSQYFYLYGLSGLNEAEKELDTKTEAADATIGQALGGFSEMMSGISSAGNAASDTIKNPGNAGKNVKGIVDSYSTAKGGFDQTGEAIQGVLDDPQGFIMGVGAIVAQEGVEILKTTLAAPVAKMFCRKHLTTRYLTPDQLLKKVGVVPKGGNYYDGLDFSQSKFCLNGTNTMRITVSYELQVIKLFNYDIRFNLTQSGYTAAWFGSSSAKK